MPGLTAGFAATEITPPLGLPMAGYGGREKPAERVVDPLRAHAVVLANDVTAVAVVCADLLGLKEKVWTPMRERIAARTGIAEANVLVSCSHTHWGPELGNSAYVGEEMLALQSPEYLEELAEKLAAMVAEAWEGRQPAAVAGGLGYAADISFNRRTVNADQETVMNYALPPAKAKVASREGNRLARNWRRGEHLGPRLSRPLAEVDGLRVGPSDAEVILLRVDRADGTPLCGLVNFACHAVCGGDDDFYGWSADYPGYARAAFEALIGAPLAFTPGCSGDQVPRWREGQTRARVGKPVGGEAAHVWLGIDACSGEVPLSAARKRVTLPPNGLRTGLEEPGAEASGAAGTEVEVWAMRVGDLALVGLPGEILTEIGMQIKQRSPFPYTMVASQANGYIGYICTDNAIREGGYEPTGSAVGAGSERSLVETALELLEGLDSEA